MQQVTGLSTVYRGLKLLLQAGLVRCCKLPGGATVYAPLERDQHHLIRVHCGHSQALPFCPLGAGSPGLVSVMLHKPP